MQNLDLKNKTVFITGVAGFIGSNLAERLLKEIEGIKIVGLDNMNDYYDVRLKEYSPRYHERGQVYIGATPEKFRKYFSEQIKRTKEVYHKDMMFIFAWNEWGEGGYLEPDELNKYGYLEAVREALIENGEFPW